MGDQGWIRLERMYRTGRPAQRAHIERVESDIRSDIEKYIAVLDCPMKQPHNRTFVVVLSHDRPDKIEIRTIKSDVVLTTAAHLAARVEHGYSLKLTSFT